MTKEQIINDIKNNSIVLYMKGTKERPMCGFSARVVNILNQHSRAGKGSVSWNGKNEMGQNVSGGIYLYTIETPSFSKTKKMILLK